MDDKQRITLWLEKDDKWLENQQVRISKVAKKGEKCKIISRVVERKILNQIKNITQKALFYTNGYYYLGEWIPISQ
jgi:hypothetical protein